MRRVRLVVRRLVVQAAAVPRHVLNSTEKEVSIAGVIRATIQHKAIYAAPPAIIAKEARRARLRLGIAAHQARRLLAALERAGDCHIRHIRIRTATRHTHMGRLQRITSSARMQRRRVARVRMWLNLDLRVLETEVLN